MNVIQEMTKDCPREDCTLTSGLSTSTGLAWSPTYDKSGNRTDRGDPNYHNTEYRCSKCGASWIASTRFNETKITRIEHGKR